MVFFLYDWAISLDKEVRKSAKHSGSQAGSSHPSGPTFLEEKTFYRWGTVLCESVRRTSVLLMQYSLTPINDSYGNLLLTLYVP
jgi:hypothetical protein